MLARGSIVTEKSERKSRPSRPSTCGRLGIVGHDREGARPGAAHVERLDPQHVRPGHAGHAPDLGRIRIRRGNAQAGECLRGHHRPVGSRIEDQCDRASLVDPSGDQDRRARHEGDGGRSGRAAAGAPGAGGSTGGHRHGAGGGPIALRHALDPGRVVNDSLVVDPVVDLAPALVTRTPIRSIAARVAATRAGASRDATQSDRMVPDHFGSPTDTVTIPLTPGRPVWPPVRDGPGVTRRPPGGIEPMRGGDRRSRRTRPAA